MQKVSLLQEYEFVLISEKLAINHMRFMEKKVKSQ